jgi:hypothetical protein
MEFVLSANTFTPDVAAASHGSHCARQYPHFFQVLTRRDSPRVICPVMVAKWVWTAHFMANWKR